MKNLTITHMLITGIFCASMFVGIMGHAEVVVEVGSTYTDAGVTASDVQDGDITAKVVVANTVNTSKLGTYKVTYNVENSLGLAANLVVRTVRVADRTKPVIALNGSASITIKKGITYVDAGATATDNYDGNLASMIVVTGTVNTAKLGTYYKYYNVNDSSSNAATTIKRKVVVVATAAKCELAELDITAPVDGSKLYVPESDSRIPLTMTASTLADVETVSFTLDGVPFGMADKAPYVTITELDLAKFGLGEHHLVATANTKTGEEINTETVFTVAVADAQNDSNGDGLPDNPFATLSGNGDTWIYHETSMTCFASDEENANATVMTFLEGIENKLNSVQVSVPRALLSERESAILVVELDESTNDGPNATVQILTSDDGGQTLAPLDDMQIAAHPIQVVLQGNGSTWKANLVTLATAEK